MFRSILPIAKNTFTDMVRQKVFITLLLFALFAIGTSIFMANLSFQEQFQMLKDTCLGAMSVFTILLAVLATSGFLPRDLEDRTIYTLLSKPVPRFAYLMGKLGGIIMLLFLFIVLMSVFSSAMLGWQEYTVLADTRTQMAGAPPEELKAALLQITNATFNVNLIPGVLIIFIMGALLASLTLFISTFSTSSLFTILIAFAVCIIGYLQPTAREYWLHGTNLHWWSHLGVGLLALMFPDLQSFSLTDDIIAGAAIPLGIFLQTFGLGCVYVIVYFSLAAFVFSGREL